MPYTRAIRDATTSDDVRQQICEDLPVAAQINLGRRFTVLVADDESSILRVLALSLDKFGFATLEATGFDDALRYIRANRVDAAILDVRMPGGGSGLELLEAIRADATITWLPVIILTGNVLTDKEAKRVRELRAHVFYKPTPMETLAQKLREQLGRGPVI
jgi:two-component system chemotaxis response regulator CheY